MSSALFRFDSHQHEYIETATGLVLPHITGLLAAAGLVDDRWYTEESSARGQAVHRLTASYDLGALDIDSVSKGRDVFESLTDMESDYRGYLLSYALAKTTARITILDVEVPRVHPRFLFGGRPDRKIQDYNKRVGPFELKSRGGGWPGHDEERAYRVQTALQAILMEDELKVPAWGQGRWAVYINDKGQFRFKEYHSLTNARADVDEAHRIIKQYVRSAA